MAERGKPLYLGGNSFEVVHPCQRRNTASGLLEPATGLALSVHIAATENGTAIHSSLSKSVNERSSMPGEYFAIFDGDDVNDNLAPYADEDVYEIFGNGADINFVTIRRVFPNSRP